MNFNNFFTKQRGRKETLLSLPKSLYVNLRLLPFKQAIRLPIMVRYNTILRRLSGRCIISGEIKRGMLKLGFPQVDAFDEKYERTSIQMEGTLKLNGVVNIGHGSRICVGKKGVLEIDNAFYNSCGLTVICNKEIHLGENAHSSWQVIIMDTDFHNVRNLETHEVYPCEKPIKIGKGVWLGMRSVILKGSEIADGCIVGSNSVINKKFKNPNTIIAGNPAAERKSGVERAYDLESWSLELYYKRKTVTYSNQATVIPPPKKTEPSR